MKLSYKNLILLGLCLFLLLLIPKPSQAQNLLTEYLFPIEISSADVTKNDVIGLRIYQNTENKDALTWYHDNVVNAASSVGSVTVDGYQGVQDGRTIYVNAANLDGSSLKCSGGNNDTHNCIANTDCPGGNCQHPFYTNIYVLAYNQNADSQTIEIFNQMIKNMKFNKNILDLYCLNIQSQVLKDKLRRDTIRKADFYKMNQIFAAFSGGLNLRSGTYVPNMSLSTWPSWEQTLGAQLGATLPKDPLNLMALTIVTCSTNADCGNGQCTSAGYCSQCPAGYNADTCWDEKNKKYFDVDGYVYKFKNNNLIIRYENPEIQLLAPASGSTPGDCQLGCLSAGKYYYTGSCLANNQYCDAGTWVDNKCGDGFIRCQEACDCNIDINNIATDLANCHCQISYDNASKKFSGCLSCETNYHSIGGTCYPDTRAVSTLTQTLSTSEEQIWNGSAWSTPYALGCKPLAVIDAKGVCQCIYNYHEVGSQTGGDQCVPSQRTFTCDSSLKPDNSVWNTVSSFQQTWDGTKWVPADFMTSYDPTPSSTECLYKCIAGFHIDNNACVPDVTSNNSPPITYSCTGTDYTQVAHAVVCPSPNATDLTANVANTLVATCSNNPANCEYTCEQGFIPAGNTCVAATCSGDSTQSCTIANGVAQQTRSCTNPPAWDAWGACTVLSCNTNYVQSGNSCILSACTGDSTQSCTIANGTGQQVRTCITPANADAYWSDWGACTVTACDSFFHVVSGACVPYVCTGTDPVSATICPGQGVGLSADTAKSSVNYCSPGSRCQYQCNLGYVLDNSNPRKCVQGNLAFVTSEKFDGKLGGVAGADAKCQAEGNARGVLGTFKAWISTGVWDQGGNLISDINPENHFVQPSAGIYYRLIDGTAIANGWAGLASGGLLAPINKDLKYPSDPIINPAEYVWTNTLQSEITGGWGNTDLCACSGSAYTGNACKDYTSNSSSDSTNKALGSTGGTGFNWTQQGYGSGAAVTCNTTLRLFCFGQNSL